jgi:predicted dehydrogenase
MTMRLGIMSFAHLHAEGYIRNLRANPEVEMIGFADDNLERGRHFAQKFNARLFDSYEALIAEKPDGVVICTENACHRPVVEMAAEAGVHVLSEKPLATTLEDARAMLDVCERNNVWLMTAFPMRFNAPILEVKRVLDSGALGRLYGINSTNQGKLPRYHTDYVREWFEQKDLAGGGAAMDHIVHLADLLRWYLGQEVVEVYAQMNAIPYREVGVEVETAGLVMLTFEDGTFASIDCSWSKPPSYPTWGGLAMELVGENGLLTVDAFKQTTAVYGEQPKWVGWASDANQAMVDEFVAAIRENRPPTITGYDGYKAVEIVLAAYESAARGEPVRLPLE